MFVNLNGNSTRFSSISLADIFSWLFHFGFFLSCYCWTADGLYHRERAGLFYLATCSCVCQSGTAAVVVVCWFVFSHLQDQRQWQNKRLVHQSPQTENTTIDEPQVGWASFSLRYQGLPGSCWLISLGNVSRMPVILFPDAFIAVDPDQIEMEFFPLSF